MALVTKEKVIVLVGSYAVPDITSTYTTSNNGVSYTAIDTYTASLQDEAGATTDVVTWDDTWKTLTGVKEGKGKLILTPSDTANDTLEIPFEVVTQVNNTFEITATPDKASVKLGETQTWSVNLPSDVTTYTATVTPNTAGTYDTSTHTFTPATEGAYSIEFSATKNYYYKVPDPSANTTIMMKNSAVIALASMGRNMYVIATNNGDTNAAKHKFDPNTGCHIANGVTGGNNLNYTISAVIDGETVNWTHSQIRFNAGSSGSKASNYAATKDLTKTVTVQSSVVSDTVVDPDTPSATITVTPDTDLTLDLTGNTEVTKTFTVSATNYNVTVTPTDGGSYNTSNHTFIATKAGSYSLVFTDTDTQATTTLTVEVTQSVVDTELVVTPTTVSVEEGQTQAFVVSESTYTATVSPTTLGTIDTSTGIFTAGTAGSGTITFSANTGASTKTSTVNITVTAKAVDPTPVTPLSVTPAGPLSLKVGDTQVFSINHADSEYTVTITPENAALFDKTTKTLTAGTTAQSATVTFSSIKAGDTTVIPVSITITQEEVTSVALSKYSDTAAVGGAEVEVTVTTEAQDYTLSGIDTSIIEVREDKSAKKFYVKVLDTATGVRPVDRTTITVLAKADGKLQGSATFGLTIEDKIYTTTLEIVPSILTMQVGSESTVVINTNADDFTFSNSNTGVVTFDKDTRKLYANAVGSSSIIFTAKNKTGQTVNKTLTVNVEAAPVIETILTVAPTGPVSVVNGDNQQFVVSTNADDYTVEVLDTGVATFSKEDNILRSVGVGDTTVTFKATRKDSTEKTVEVAVSVTSVNISADISELTINKGESKSFNISSNITNEVVASVSEAGIVAVTKKGSLYTVDALAVGNVDITLKGRDKVITIPVTVTDVTTLSVAPQVKELVVGNTYRATVTTNAPTFQVECNPTDILSVSISDEESNKVLISPVGAGEATITVKATAAGGEEAKLTWKVNIVVETEYTKEEANEILTDTNTTVAEKISRFSNDVGSYGKYVSRLVQYNKVMSPTSETEITDEKGATRNYNLYIQIKDTISKEDYSVFKAEFDIINMVFVNFAKDAFDEFALFRYDQAWAAKWGNDSLTTFQNLCTVICSLCNIKTRASNLDSINLDKALDITENDISEIALNNIKKYYTV